ncbi:hypothetical protein EKG37_11130 [Robertmurraya yapensis]|uniref:Uncharacterized protein n=1 Tax=Bacillus yapensis TaxID=2492960 RepID=A0A3S0IFS0_9BACI|nr:hypothetical protein EKG37_11130 [Bacillus yapensis]TKS95773.1 hypothetical protein FAR12_11130 [Bacillus yapensis]
MIFGLFAASVVLLFGAIYNFLSLKKPGFYPPKRVLKKRAVLLASIAVVCILLGWIVSFFK